MFQRAPCTGLLPWIPLLAASVNPEETPLFRKELTGETHKAEGERVRGKEEWWKWGQRGSSTWAHAEPMREEGEAARVRRDISIVWTALLAPFCASQR